MSFPFSLWLLSFFLADRESVLFDMIFHDLSEDLLDRCGIGHFSLIEEFIFIIFDLEFYILRIPYAAEFKIFSGIQMHRDRSVIQDRRPHPFDLIGNLLEILIIDSRRRSVKNIDPLDINNPNIRDEESVKIPVKALE